MNKNPLTSKLDNEQRIHVCEMIARFVTPTNIRKAIKEQYGISITLPTISDYKNSSLWQPVINKMRDEYLSSILEVPIAHKRVRLERLENIYQKAMAQGHGSQAKEALASARDEIEGKASNNQISIQMNKIDMLPDEELRKRLEKIKREMIDADALVTTASVS